MGVSPSGKATVFGTVALEGSRSFYPIEKFKFFYYGEVGEWSNPADCKSAAYGFEGSNPSLTTTFKL